MDDQTVSLSDLQIDLMRVLWARGSATAADVTDAVANERGLAHTTVATLLGRLEKRGVLQASRDGRQVLYTPLVSEAQVRRSMVSGLLGSLFGGNARELVAHLVDSDELAPGDLHELQRLFKDTPR